MSHGASPSPWWTLNAISPTAVRLAFGAEAAAAPATSASVDMTATQSRKLPKMTTGPLCASDHRVPSQPELSCKLHSRRRGRHGGRGSRTQGIETRVLELAAEAERGYDLSKAKRRRVGRPSLGARGTSPRVSFRTTPELYRAAKRRAREEGRTVSELARDAVARYVGS
jgi:hypothetical protein